MLQIRYVEIEKFKSFDDKIRIELGHPAVLIGPNNAGKTSVIQALALWSRGIKAWYDKKGQPKQKEGRERISAGINRLNLFELPVSDTRQLWKDTRVTKNNAAIGFNITVGVNIGGEVFPCELIFTRRNAETIYCRPAPEIVDNDRVLEYASKLKFNLLYPMSGIEAQETLLPEGRINVLMGQGQTAQVLRNLAYMITENNISDWHEVQRLLKQLFMVELKTPVFNEVNGSIELSYREGNLERDLDISMSGRGLQQMLLILTYLYAHKKSVLLIDEPDAHLEILRQKQVYEILKQIARQNQCQVVIATHSEVILDDAIDTNLTLLIGGSAVDMATQGDIKVALRSIGIEHYYKAKIHPRILYIEGSTDIEILKALAGKLNHKAADIFFGKLNCYYTQDVIPERSLDSELDRAAGAFGNFKQHFHTLRRFVGDFKGIAVFDSDGQNKQDYEDNGLKVCYWKNYELENYFIFPDVLLAYADDVFESEGELFKSVSHNAFVDVVNGCLLNEVFDGDEKQLEEFQSASKNLKRRLLRSIKMSAFSEKVFKKYAEEQRQPVLMNKGDFYQLVDYIDVGDIPDEVSDKLDAIYDALIME